MSNPREAFYTGIENIQSTALRDITFLLCSDSLKHPLILEGMYYPTFQLVAEGQLGLNYYKDLKEKEIQLLESIETKTALGRYAERLLAAWFMLNPNYDVLAFNLQLICGGKTLGEIDLLLWEKINRRAIHLEFALKFYLAHRVGESWKFTGPKGRDTLEGKSRKLVDHQMRLCIDHKHLLPKELSHYNFEASLMMKGNIFYPFNLSNKSNKWLKRTEINLLDKWKQARFRILETRRDWIYPYDPAGKHSELSYQALTEKLTRLSLPIMLVYDFEGEEGLLMVVEDSWPNIER
jgi:hypothetical protein